jgi:hypothetical protein
MVFPGTLLLAYFGMILLLRHSVRCCRYCVDFVGILRFACNIGAKSQGRHVKIHLHVACLLTHINYHNLEILITKEVVKLSKITQIPIM